MAQQETADMYRVEQDGVTIHPFSDEWLFAPDGVKPLVVEDATAAAREFAEWKRARLNHPALADHQREFYEGAWAAVFAYRADGGFDGLVAVIAPDGTTYGEDLCENVYAQIGVDGEWPEVLRIDKHTVELHENGVRVRVRLEPSGKGARLTVGPAADESLRGEAPGEYIVQKG